MKYFKSNCNKFIWVLIAILLNCQCGALEHTKPANFNQAKIITKHIFSGYPTTIYSGCKLDVSRNIDYHSCGFDPNPQVTRDLRIEFEHMFPMSHAKHHFRCWREPLCVDKNGRRFKGRRCCQQIDPNFMALEGELYNLWPEIGSINQDRRDFKFTEFSQTEKNSLRKHRNLPIYIDFVHRRIEPRDEMKGLVARANLYVAKKYNIILSSSQFKLLTAWNREFPPTEMELRWAATIVTITGEQNQFINDWKCY